MNKPYSILKDSCALLALVVLSVSNGSLLAQSYSVTNISVPGNFPVAVSALNATGQVAGYYQAPTGPLAFRWENGVTLNLGTLGGLTSMGNALNKFGEVAGSSTSIGDTATHAFLAIGQTLFDLQTLGGVNSAALAISDGGFVTGNAEVDPSRVEAHAFLFDGVTMHDLGTLGGSQSAGFAVNDSGQVAGDSTVDARDTNSHGFLYHGTLTDLGTLGGTASSAAALNAAGQVTGDSTLAGDVDTHAFLYDGTMHDLGTLGGTFSSAYVINDAGQITGDAETATGENHAFFYNGTMIDLGTLGGDFSTPLMLNNAGQVVGFSRNALDEQRAFLWQNGVLRDLNTLLPANSGWTLTTANFINDRGQIVGVGTYQGVSTYFQLSPRAQENHPPIARAGADQNVGATGPTALVTVDGSNSSDPDGDSLSFLWLEGGVSLGAVASATLPFAIGTHNITLRVTDPSGASAEDRLVVVVADVGPPVVQCPADRSASAGDDGLAAVPDLLAGLVASDNGTPAPDLVKTQAPSAGTRMPCGSSTIVITVADAAGNTATCRVGFTVSDTTAPRLTCPDPITVSPDNNCRTVVPDLSTRISVTDNCTPANQLSFHQEPAAGTLVGGGNHEIHVTVADQAGNTALCTVLLHVIGSAGPVIQSLTANPNVLRPANHQMAPVSLTAIVVDACDPAPVCRIVAVSSSEPESDGRGSGSAPDWEITGPLTLNLRAEVISKDTPRIYTICVACTDAAGNVARRTVTVTATKNNMGN